MRKVTKRVINWGLGLLVAGGAGLGVVSRTTNWFDWILPRTAGSLMTDEARYLERAERNDVNCDGPTANDVELYFADVLLAVTVFADSLGNVDHASTPAEIFLSCINHMNAFYSDNERDFSPSSVSRLRFAPYLGLEEDGQPGLSVLWDSTGTQYYWNRGEEEGTAARHEAFAMRDMDALARYYNFGAMGIYGGAHAGYGAIMSYGNVQSLTACHEWGHMFWGHTFDFQDPTDNCETANQWCDVADDPKMGSSLVFYDEVLDKYYWSWAEAGYNPSDVVKGYTVTQWGDDIPFTNIMSYYSTARRHVSHEQLIEAHYALENYYLRFQPRSWQEYDTLGGGDLTVEYDPVKDKTEITFVKVAQDLEGHLAFADWYLLATAASADFSLAEDEVEVGTSFDQATWTLDVDGDRSGESWLVLAADSTEGWTYEYLGGEWWDYTGEDEPDWSLLGTWSTDFDDVSARGGCGWE